MSAIKKHKIYSIVQITSTLFMCIYIITAVGLNGWEPAELNSPLGISMLAVIVTTFVVYTTLFVKKIKLEDAIMTAMDNMIYKEFELIEKALRNIKIDSSSKQ